MKKNVYIKFWPIVIGLALIASAQLLLPLPAQFHYNPLFVLLIVAVILYFLLTDLKNSKKMIRNALVTIILFGTVISFAKPVQFGLDEETHLINVIRLADGGIFQYEKESLPDYKAVEHHDILRSPSTYTNQDYWLNVKHKESKFSGAIIKIINPSYIPSAIGWNVGKLFSRKIFVSYYLGRIFNILFYALLVYFALKISKYYRELLYLVSTFPAVLYTCAGFHYDTIYYGFSLILLALWTNLLARDEPIGKKEMIAFQLTTLPFAFAKFPFILSAFLISILPKRYYYSTKERLLSFYFGLLIVFVSLVYYVHDSILTRLTGVSVLVSDIGTRPSLFYFMRHPFPLLRTFVNTMIGSLSAFSNALHYTIANSDFLNSFSYLLFLLLLLGVSVRIRLTLKRSTKIMVWTIFAIISFLIIYAIAGDPRVYHMGDILVNGVQTRYYYFMVASLPLLVAEPSQKLFLSQSDLIAEDDQRFVRFMQYSIAYLTILTIAVAIYTQVPHVL
ncbi:DUF2142 domain-containing protein [Streptococcus sciuri]|uniref:DUF2142 domain-containing protein n=1 Tax=Streptococcus sciuri TaxID=2973939 RepID=A0ABT2F6C9_9STRE|nr:DUF2142 domain-containing protein [Streptococcus sciuri]MCS4488041.1 DUF2142 domain-containing protein [Streptococcus sciuri]